MPIAYRRLAQPKPVKAKTLKRKRQHLERMLKTAIRAACVERDGYCRYRGVTNGIGFCDGPSEWAHLGDKRRARTRGLSSEQRHTTAGSLMLCRRHHRLYDTHRLIIRAVTDAGADGLIVFEESA
jgi:hypothetical protein